MEKKFCNIGTIGHVDHGKTTLSAAISCVLAINSQNFEKNFGITQIDKAPEEKSRGITINATQIHYFSANRSYAHIDCPGHQHYIKNMIAGTASMDGAILVVSGIDGPQEQTREHILLCKEIGIKSLVLYVNKMDNSILDQDLLDFVDIEVRDLLTAYGFDGMNIPFIFGSARVALESNDSSSSIGFKSVQQLMEVVDYQIEQPERELDKPFLMYIDSVHSISGRGTVLAGKINKGTVLVGDDLEIIGFDELKKTTCTGLEFFKTTLNKGVAGASVGILVRGIKKTDVRRGQIICKPDTYSQYKKFKAQFYVLTEEDGGRSKPFFSGYRPQFYFKNFDITGTVTLPEDLAIANPGDNILIEVDLFKPIFLEEQLKFTVREGSKTIGGGLIVEFI